MARIKAIRGLDCSARSDKMLRLVLLAQLKAMCDMRSKALDWKDPEGVHDMRVFSRRLRTAISDFRPYLGKVELPVLELKKIAKALGAVRDEDVALIALEGFKANVSIEVASGIEMFAQECRSRQEEARADLKKVISPQAIKQFRREFQAKLKMTPPRASTLSKKNLSFMDVGVKVINTRLNELTAASQFIYLPFESLGIHELRILAKRLRYAIQSFSSCWGNQAEEMAREISFLQDSLGALHDCDVWIERLAKRIVETAATADSDGEGSLRKAAVWLLGHLANLRAEHYRDALARWHRWEVEGFLTSIKLMLDRNVAAQTNAP